MELKYYNKLQKNIRNDIIDLALKAFYLSNNQTDEYNNILFHLHLAINNLTNLYNLKKFNLYNVDNRKAIKNLNTEDKELNEFSKEKNSCSSNNKQNKLLKKIKYNATFFEQLHHFGLVTSLISSVLSEIID